MTNRQYLFLTLYLIHLANNYFANQIPSQFNFIVPEPGFLQFDQAPTSVLENHTRNKNFNTQNSTFFKETKSQMNRVLESSSSGARNLKVHVDFFSLESLETEKRVYIESRPMASLIGRLPDPPNRLQTVLQNPNQKPARDAQIDSLQNQMPNRRNHFGE